MNRASGEVPVGASENLLLKPTEEDWQVDRFDEASLIENQRLQEIPVGPEASRRRDALGSFLGDLKEHEEVGENCFGGELRNRREREEERGHV